MSFRFSQDGPNTGLVATLEYTQPGSLGNAQPGSSPVDNTRQTKTTSSRTAPGLTIRITNVYNRFPADPNNRVDLPEMTEGLAGHGYDLLLGDFNLHLPGMSRLADSRTGEHKRQAELLQNLMADEELQMELITPEYLTTFTRSELVAYAGTALSVARTKESWVEDGLFSSDHRLIGHEFQIEVIRVLPQRKLWKDVNPEEFRQFTLDRIFNGISTHVDNPQDDVLPFDISTLEDTQDTRGRIDAVANTINAAIVDAMDQKVKTVDVHPTYTIRPRDLAVLTRHMNEARQEYRKARTVETLRDFEECKRKVELAESDALHQLKLARRHRLAHGSRPIHKVSKGARRYFQPTQVHVMLALTDDPAKKATHVSNEDKALACAHAIWTEEGVSDNPDNEPPLSIPEYPPSENDPTFSPTITAEEVHKILVSLPTNKSGDVYGLHNRALRMLASEDKEGRFERLLANLFTACLTIGYFAEAWKTALIVMIPKRGKSRYDLAKSWRPLALLSLVGKILEKIVARRLQSSR